MEIYTAVLNTLVCLAALATGVSAVVAVVHHLRHWRDEEVKLAVEVLGQEADSVGGKAYLRVALRVTNVGKAPVTVTALEIVEKDVAEKFALDLKSEAFDEFLHQGASVEYGASLTAEERGVALPERFTMRAKWKEHPESFDGAVVVETAQAGPARE